MKNNGNIIIIINICTKRTEVNEIHPSLIWPFNLCLLCQMSSWKWSKWQNISLWNLVSSSKIRKYSSQVHTNQVSYFVTLVVLCVSVLSQSLKVGVPMLSGKQWPNLLTLSAANQHHIPVFKKLKHSQSIQPLWTSLSLHLCTAV